jgi:acyl carrier protein
LARRVDWSCPGANGAAESGGEPVSGWGTASANALAVRGRAGGAVEWEVVGVASVYDRVRSIIAERLGVDEEKVTMEAEFIGDLNADSLDLVEVIMAMEQEFNLEIKDEDAENIRTVGDAVQYIEEHGG